MTYLNLPFIAVIWLLVALALWAVVRGGTR